VEFACFWIIIWKVQSRIGTRWLGERILVSLSKTQIVIRDNLSSIRLKSFISYASFRFSFSHFERDVRFGSNIRVKSASAGSRRRAAPLAVRFFARETIARESAERNRLPGRIDRISSEKSSDDESSRVSEIAITSRIGCARRRSRNRETRVSVLRRWILPVRRCGLSLRVSIGCTRRVG